VDGLLQELEEREVEMDRLTTEARVSARRSRRHEELLAESTNRLARREEEIEREARARVERYLLEARRDVETEVERLRSEVARAVQAGEADPGAFDDAVRQARSAVEERLRDRTRRKVWPSPFAWT
jgi:dsDNA-specific endonuclease/ATPase MutS2